MTILCLLGGLLVSAGAYANGVIPVLELDFTRVATETLKKHGINDACIIAAANPGAFTYCREGSATLWKYQALDLDQQANTLKGTKLASMDDGRISIVEVDSVACAEDTHEPLVHPTLSRALALGLIILFLIIGLRHTYRASMDGFFVPTMSLGAHMQRSASPLRSNRSTTKALRAFSIAAVIALVYFGYTTL
ncbi:hypothetical protein T3H00_26600 [Pseudomonas fluorescens]|jgi:hypothetical protein|uniref:hypothetical protein n=1 Tax=Pseudomonas fluorescens TaxID=294 RepID=UPI002ACA3903|nr:hypothetical protein [Pseudomonas fluorescens]MDZ5436223.1 hypothetical protein [Pseudomonas fluorescens]